MLHWRLSEDRSPSREIRAQAIADGFRGSATRGVVLRRYDLTRARPHLRGDVLVPDLAAFFLGGMQKTAVLSEFRPHLFFDDQVAHLRTAAAVAPCVHVPFGVRNRVA